MNSIVLLLALIGQTPSYNLLTSATSPDYMLLPEEQIVPEPVPSPPINDWHEIVRPAHLATEWVWGHLAADGSGDVNWNEDEQDDAWKRAGKTPPGFLMTDAYGKVWKNRNKIVLQRFINDQQAKYTAEHPIYQQPIYEQPRTWSSSVQTYTQPTSWELPAYDAFSGSVNACVPGLGVP